MVVVVVVVSGWVVVIEGGGGYKKKRPPGIRFPFLFSFSNQKKKRKIQEKATA